MLTKYHGLTWPWGWKKRREEGGGRINSPLWLLRKAVACKSGVNNWASKLFDILTFFLEQVSFYYVSKPVREIIEAKSSKIA